MTMNSCQLRAASFETNSVSRRSGWRTRMFRAAAHIFTGGEVSAMPLPFGLSGVVTTSDGTSPSLSRSSRNTVASSGVPKNAKRVSLFFFTFFVIQLSCFVGVENALEMVDFVLEDVREETGCAAREALAMFVVCANGSFLGTWYGAPLAANRKAALVFFFLSARHLDELGIDVHLIRHRRLNTMRRRLIASPLWFVGSTSAPASKGAT